MADEDRARAPVGRDCLVDVVKNVLDRVLLRHRHAKRMERIDLVELQRRFFEIRPGKRFDVMGYRMRPVPAAFRRPVEHHRRHFEQGVPLGIETAGLHVDNDGQKAPEAACYNIFLQLSLTILRAKQATA